MDKSAKLKEGVNLERVQLVLQDPFYLECLARNKTREMERVFCRHDYQHAADVARVAYILALESGESDRCTELHGLQGCLAAREVIYAAGFLHDIARWLQYDTGEDHAIAGARLAGPLLADAGFGEFERELICEAIAEHRTISIKKTWLGAILSRADDLSRPCLQCGVKSECRKFSSAAAGAALLY
ncbi:MAG: HD domain-containing protein [Eubacteriales bacterium]